MDADTSSFGRAIAGARKRKGMSQKALAGLIAKEDGAPITQQYLNDIEHDRRSPSSDHLVRQFAAVLGISEDVLYWLAGRLPAADRRQPVTPERIEQAFVAFRRELKGGR